jgi:hypothetical protein
MVEWRATEIFSSPELRLIAIESIGVERYRCGGCHGITANLAPCAVLAIGEHGIDALDPLTGKTLAFERLRRDLPGLDDILASVRDAPGG